MGQATSNMPDRTKRLVILRFSALGDVALTAPVLLGFLKAYPDHVLTVVTRPKYSPIFKNLTRVQVLEAQLQGEHKGIIGLFRLYKSIRELQPKAIVDLHNVLRTKILRFFLGFHSVKIKAINKGRADKRSLTRSENKILRPLKHTAKRYKEVFEDLGFNFDLNNTHTLPSRPMPVNIPDIANSKGKLLGFAPFAAHEGKMYSLEKLENVIKGLTSQLNCTILCFGGGNKEQAAIEHWAKEFPNCYNLIGKVSFAEELDVISNLDLMLSMDSGNGHLAAIFGVPTLTLWGITHPYAGFAPYGQPEENSLLADIAKFPKVPTSIYGNACPPGYEEAINTISEDAIISKIKAILGHIT
ncbi:MAG: glycosyltransferase family 9 protein [Flavobacteriaceae bacterium]|nr:glycosyltransferase family 9 protein [Flavobacteriaceae bacterium]